MVKNKSEKSIETIEGNLSGPSKAERIQQQIKDFKKMRKMECEESFLLTSLSGREWPSVPTSSKSIDDALGIGGFPVGRLTLVHGPESSCKTSLCLSAMVQWLKKNPDEIAVVIDKEHAIDGGIFKLNGVDLDNPDDPVGNRIIIEQPMWGEDAAELVEEYLKSGLAKFVILDSIAACDTLKENAGKYISDENKRGGLARVMQKLYSVLPGIVHSQKAIFIGIQQERDDQRPGPTQVRLNGGRAIRFYSSIIMRTQRIGNILQGESVIGIKLKAKVSKNKLSAPFKVAEYSFYFDYGFDRVRELIDMAVDAKIIKKAGAWYTFQDEKYYMKDLLPLIRNNPEHVEMLESFFSISEMSAEEINDVEDELLNDEAEASN